MRQKIKKLKRIVIIAIIVQLLALVAMYFLLDQAIVISLLVLIAECIVAVMLFEKFENISDEQSSGVKGVLGTVAEEAYITGGIGLVIYNDDYEVTWMSELFKVRHIDRVGSRLLTWIPEAEELLSGTSDVAEVRLDDRIYELTRKEDAPVLFFRDVTELQSYKQKYSGERLVLGLASFDNYEESIEYEDDADAAQISANVRVPLTEYCNAHGILARRLGASRYLLVLNEKILNEIAEDRFSVLSKVRKAATKMDVSITLSMSFARGTSDYNMLDDMATNLIDLAETRGGDQVAVQAVGEEVKYFGGSTEAVEKRSRVRVRVMSHALRNLLDRSSNVIICGHKMADFDCMGSAICLARMAKALNKESCVIALTGGIEEKLKDALDANKEALKEEVNFVTDSEALNQLNDNTLVIMTDHHNLKQSNGAKVLEVAKKVVVIDHHRRSTDMGVKPVLVYIEAAASSTCELLTEMIPFVSNRTDISEVDANLMLTGMIVDTQNWHVRTGSRTYEAASALRAYGADPQKTYGFLKDTFEEFALKSAVANSAERYSHGVVIAAVTDRKMTRSLMSQVADSLLSIQQVESAFVIAQDEEGTTCISARSAGRMNVQVIMEKMGGGGHMTAAAMQRPKAAIADIKAELLDKVNEYLEEEEAENESNS